MIRPNLATLRRLEALENRRGTVRPRGAWPAIVRSFEEWERMAEPQQTELARLTRAPRAVDIQNTMHAVM